MVDGLWTVNSRARPIPSIEDQTSLLVDKPSTINHQPMPQTANCNRTDPWLAHTVRVDRITPEVAGVATYDLVFTDEATAAEFAFRPGQFNMLYLPGVGEAAISICGNPAETSRLPHTIRHAGNVTQELSRLQPGATIGLRGPFGSHWPIEECDGKDVILVAGGVGLPPFRPVIYEILADRDRFGRVSLLYGSRTPETLLYTDQFDQWRAAGIEVIATVDRATSGWKGHVGVVTLLLERLAVPIPEDTFLFTCGPEVMMWYVIQTARSRGIPTENLWMSLERNMNCAIGLCGHCQFGPEFLCKDGPVLRFDRVAPFLKVEQL
jgi:NAD(P)H-flavin reductase